MHSTYSDQAVSIKTALDEAAEGRVGSYLALTDSIIGVIKCCPTSIASTRDEGESQTMKDHLIKVYIFSILNNEYSV